MWSTDEQSDIWLWDLARATLTRITFDPGNDNYPTWTPDGRQLLFSSERGSRNRNVFRQAADGATAIEQLTRSPNIKNPTSVSPDGTRLVFTETVPGTSEDIMALSLGASVGSPGQAGARSAPLIQTPFAERNGEISPGGRWIAYEANESGQFEIYVRPFPDVAQGRWQVSSGGGTRPLWARNEQELFYMTPTGALMRVAVTPGATWAASRPVQLFKGPYWAGAGGLNPGRTYDASPDARRFLMIKLATPQDSTDVQPISLVVVQNWDQELKRLVPSE